MSYYLNFYSILFIKKLLCASHCFPKNDNPLRNMPRYIISLIIINNNMVTLGEIGKPILGKNPDLHSAPIKNYLKQIY